MKVLVLLLAVAACRADNCDNSFGDFLNNLKSGIDKNAQALQQEIKDDEATLAKKCFDDSTSGSKCALTDDELHTDCFGDSGPMKGCDRCIKLSGSLRDKFLKSDPNTRKCFRQHLGKAIKEELEPCIQGKISNGYSFRVPDLPDFEEKTFDYIDLVLQGISEDVMIHSRLDACQNVNPAKFAISGPCVDNGYAGIYSKHCQVAKDAKAKAVSSACLARFNEVKTATCQCMVEKKQDWHQRFDKIKTIVDDTAAQSIEASACGDQSTILSARGCRSCKAH